MLLEGTSWVVHCPKGPTVEHLRNVRSSWLVHILCPFEAEGLSLHALDDVSSNTGMSSVEMDDVPSVSSLLGGTSSNLGMSSSELIEVPSSWEVSSTSHPNRHRSAGYRSR